MNKNYFISGVALLVAILALFVGLTMHASNPTAKFGGVTNYDSLQVKTLQVGTTGTIIGNVVTGTCNLLPAATTIAASSTATVDCQASATGQPAVALTGVTAGDAVQLQYGTTTSTLYTGLRIVGANASSTPGYITALIFNGTGATYTWATNGTSTLIYQDAALGKVQGL